MTDNKKKRGRPPLSQTEPTVFQTVSLTTKQVEFLRAHGSGNVSLGIRRLIDEKQKSQV